ncbi:HAD family hydrolase [Anianabacter salinae]|uniref:HAD family hydrolase n=1 Tax=Anianabacter salinae TaxID=2851023 RepID=UPI00225E2E03|nr:HAD family phosphatase [Anianabacter salinae]MBV0913328.1 HAD family phosphatase [Anianabacter salinae]
MTINAVVFDIGNVLIGWDPEPVYDRLIGPDRRAGLFAGTDVREMNLDIDRGHDFSTRIRQSAAAHPNWHDEIMLWEAHWIEMLGPVIPHSVALLRALRSKGVPVFALSNFGVATLKMADAEYPFLTEFDRRFISGDLRLIKPDPAIYRAVEDATGLAPETLLFADDRPENIVAAEARGWNGHLFEAPEGWAARLVSEGLLTDSEAAP